MLQQDVTNGAEFKFPNFNWSKTNYLTNIIIHIWLNSLD